MQIKGSVSPLTPSTAGDMANRVELTGSRIVIESVCGGAEREGGFYLVSTVCVCARKKRRFFFSNDRGFSLRFLKVAPVAKYG
jgi:hypothetical protein